MRRIHIAALAAAVVLAGCSAKELPGTTGATGVSPFKIGQTDFVSQSPSGGARNGGGPEAAAGDSNSTTGGTGTSGAGGAGGGATQNRTIEEADIYKVVGNTLYVLNAYRGLQIIDVSDLAHPHLEAKVAVIGTPKDLYVEGNTAYVVVSDAFYYGYPYALGAGAEDAAGTVTTTPWIGSQVWAIDVSQPASPTVLSQLPVDGSVEETRIVGDVLYVVSDVYSWYYWGPNGSNSQNQNLTYVQSFDISDPVQMHSVQRENFPADGWNIHANVTQNRIILSESGYDYSGNSYDGPITQFIPIDISDPAGALTVGTTFSAPGNVSDRWAMDYDDSNHLFRAVLQNEYWGNNGGSLVLWNAPTVHAATQIGALTLNIPERVMAASFDGPRAYIVTAYCTDPLWIIDTSDPANPQVKGQLHMSGALDFILPRGNQLLALGHDSDGCMAWEGSGQLAVSLFDVTDPANPSMLSRVNFGSQYSYINAESDDMKKTFQVLDSLGLILVPFQSWDSTTWTQKGGTQLIDLGASSLTLRGFADHAGNIQRAFPVQDKLVALSDQSLQVLDASDRDHPQTIADLDLARPVLGLAFVGDKAVELSGDWNLGDTKLAVTEAATPDQSEPLATVSLPSPNSRMFQDGNIIWVLAHDYQQNTAWLQGVDVSNPTAPVTRGTANLDPTVVGNYYGYWSWGYGAEAALVNHALVLHNAYYGCWGDCYGSGYNSTDTLQVIDLRDPDHPVVEAPIALDGSSWSWGLTTAGNFAWITHYEWLNSGNGSQSWVRYYVDRLDLTNPGSPQLLPKINVPGVFFAASDDGQTLYTQDVTYDTRNNSWTPTTWLNKLQLLPGGLAALQATTSFAGYPAGAGLSGDYAYLLTQSWDPTTYVSSSKLNAVRLQDLAQTSSQSIGASWAYLQKAAGGKVFVQASWYDNGLLIYDLADPASPLFQGSLRTNGWISDVVVHDNTAYLPEGSYGVPMLDLTAGSPIPAQL